MIDDSITTTERAEQAQAAQAVEARRGRQVEKAWNILIQAGVVTREDIEVLHRRKRDRDLLALAADTLARAKKIAADAVAVSISTSSLVYAAEDGESPRVFPRVTTTTTRRQKPKADEQAGGKGEFSETTANGIPATVLKQASDALGLKWYGPANASRSQRVLAKARELMGQGQGQA